MIKLSNKVIQCWLSCWRSIFSLYFFFFFKSSKGIIYLRLLFLNFHCTTELEAIDNVTLSHACLTHRIDVKMPIVLAIAEAVRSVVSTLLRVLKKMTTLIYTLKFLIIPASKGCSLGVVCFGRKTTLIFEKLSFSAES